jgi:hypothetical protein
MSEGYMGRLSDYINSAPGSAGRSSGSFGGSSDVEVQGFAENLEMFERLMTTDAALERNYRTIIRRALKEARKNLSKDAGQFIKKDPRKAARAVKFSVYKKMFGGNISILSKRTHGAFTNYKKPRTLRPGQRGGNRIPYNEANSRLDKYQGADRGFILRFLNSGTVKRTSRYGNRESIRQTGWFGHIAPYHMDAAAQEIAEAINEYVKTVAHA